MKQGKLSKTEKDKIAGLYKCQRSILEQDIQDELMEELNNGISSYKAKIKGLQEEIEAYEDMIDGFKKAHGFENMDRYGCVRSHPRIDAVRGETNARLLKLWAGKITVP